MGLSGCEKPPVCAKSCNTPPVAQCNEDDDTYLTYAPAGICGADNECHYDLISTPCPQCAINCLGLCKDVECPLIDKINSCKINGVCTVKDNAPVCGFQNAPNGTTCSNGICFEGNCVECYNDRQCLSPDSGIIDCWQPSCENGFCKYQQPETPLICRTATCLDGYETAAVSCTADGNCPSADMPRFCDGLACDGDYCRTSCQDKNHCLSGYDCNTDSHLCQEELPPITSDDCHSDSDCADNEKGHFCQESTGNCVLGGGWAHPVMMMVIAILETTVSFPSVFVFPVLPEKMENRFPPVMTRVIVIVVFAGFPPKVALMASTMTKKPLKTSAQPVAAVAIAMMMGTVKAANQIATIPSNRKITVRPAEGFVSAAV